MFILVYEDTFSYFTSVNKYLRELFRKKKNPLSYNGKNGIKSKNDCLMTQSMNYSFWSLHNMLQTCPPHSLLSYSVVSAVRPKQMISETSNATDVAT